jgi:hypothetical protein
MTTRFKREPADCELGSEQYRKDSMDPEYGSGSNTGGVGLVFVLGVAVIGLGLVIM